MTSASTRPFTASPTPRRPSIQMRTNAAKARSTAMTATPCAAARHTRPRSMSTSWKRMKATPTAVTASANQAVRPDQIAARETGSSMIRRRIGSCWLRDGRGGSARLTDAFEVAPLLLGEERRRGGGDRARLKRLEPLGADRVARQEWQRHVLLGAGDAHEESSHRPRRAAEPHHDVGRKAVGGGLGVARIGRIDERAAEEDQRAAAGDVAEQESEQERAAAGLDELAHAVAARHVAELVRQDAGDLVRLPRPAQQALEEIDAPAGQRDGVRNRGVEHADLGGERELGAARERRGQLRERGAAGGAGAGLAAEQRPDLVVDRLA